MRRDLKVDGGVCVARHPSLFIALFWFNSYSIEQTGIDVCVYRIAAKVQSERACEWYKESEIGESNSTKYKGVNGWMDKGVRC